jgi:hypothetical protein
MPAISEFTFDGLPAYFMEPMPARYLSIPILLQQDYSFFNLNNSTKTVL